MRLLGVGSRARRWGRALGGHYAAAGITGCIVLFIANIAVQPSFLSQGNWAQELAVASPLLLMAVAQMPAVVSGNAGIDMSVGPFAGFINVLLVVVLFGHGNGQPYIVIPFVIAAGLIGGAINGYLIAYVRLPAIIVTLAGYLFYEGLAPEVLPSPGGHVPGWVTGLLNSVGPIPAFVFAIAIIVACWLLLGRTAFVRNLLAAGGTERAAFTAGVNVQAVRLAAYALSGLLAAVAGLFLCSVLASGDPTIGSQYTLLSIAGVALGGISMSGGRGGLLGALLGGGLLYLVQNVLTNAHVNAFDLQVADGIILLCALALNVASSRRRRSGVARVTDAGSGEAKRRQDSGPGGAGVLDSQVVVASDAAFGGETGLDYVDSQSAGRAELGDVNRDASARYSRRENEGLHS